MFLTIADIMKTWKKVCQDYKVDVWSGEAVDASMISTFLTELELVAEMNATDPENREIL